MYQTFNVKIILNGLLVKIGCQYVHFSTIDDFANALKSYLANPQVTIDLYNDSPWAKISNGCPITLGSSEPDMGESSDVEVAPLSPLSNAMPSTSPSTLRSRTDAAREQINNRPIVRGY